MRQVFVLMAWNTKQSKNNLNRARPVAGIFIMPLSFKTLRDANIARMPTFKNKHGEPAHSKPDGSDWSPAQWLQAVVGELGEYANLRKKFERGDIDAFEFQVAAAAELADAVTYLDILANQVGIDLGAAVIKKFNYISRRVNSPVRITDYGDAYYYENPEL